jgi:hypothetical protein
MLPWRGAHIIVDGTMVMMQFRVPEVVTQGNR